MFVRYDTLPKGERDSPFVDGMGIFNIASIFLGSGRHPDGVTKWPRNSTSGAPMSAFLGDNFKLYSVKCAKKPRKSPT